MKPHLLCCWLGLSCALLPVGTLEAAIDISPKRIELRGDVPQTITVSNNSDRIEYVTIATELVTNPGVHFSKEQRIPMGLIRQPTLYASPFKLILRPQQHKVITLRPLKSVASETVYRLNVRPIVQLQGTSGERLASGIAVNLSFSAIIRQRPDHEKVRLDIQCEHGGVLLIATGNVHLALKGIQADGLPVADINLYPGTPQRLPGKQVTLPGYGSCLAGKHTETEL
ncbi:alpha-related fimbriae chaperone 1 [Yersinia intermedia]|uniref:hypothetical protein n=1 Tax=Yersinia intermedia TaxID=631 RepID=UPI0005E414C7|nr:hypothetical protein [Yersinia intermedia]CNB98589.1 alpha-related fimbriae chaperone 1 [Yersinia intermedia]CNH16539.1 alpha-related fimbriae chaperone 1 [Yersinia intermedia]